jgi:hypothetical protein
VANSIGDPPPGAPPVKSAPTGLQRLAEAGWLMQRNKCPHPTHKPESERASPAEKPLSLAPLTVEAALAALLRTEPENGGLPVESDRSSASRRRPE